jgi:hypothetical protein
LRHAHDGLIVEIVKVFPAVGVIALTDDKLPLPVYEKIFSYENDFLSVNDETFHALDFAKRHFSDENIRVLDRGYDRKLSPKTVGFRRKIHHR